MEEKNIFIKLENYCIPQSLLLQQIQNFLKLLIFQVETISLTENLFQFEIL